MTGVRTLLFAGAVGALAALPVPAVAAPLVSDPAALQVLERAARAARATPYAGVQYLTNWSGDTAVSVVADVTHRPGVGSVVRVRPTPATPGAEVFDPDGAPGTFSGLPAGPFDLLARFYTLRVESVERVTGRACDVVVARRADGSVAGRFWVDRASGLMLRREVFDDRGRTVRATAFVDLVTGPHALQGQSVTAGPAEMQVPPPWTTTLAASALQAMTTHGWRVPDTLGGLRLYDARLGTADAGRVLHLSYSDGLSTVSVFEQRGRLGSLTGYRDVHLGRARVWVRDSVPERVVWSSGGSVFTVLADAPGDVVRAAVGELPHQSTHRSLWGRFVHGLARIGSWLNPFD